MSLEITEKDVHAAIDKILADVKSYPTSLNYAVNYAKAGKRMLGEELYVQCLYILGNITHWRHPDAKEVRRILKGFKFR